MNQRFLQTLKCDRSLRATRGFRFASALRLAFDHGYPSPSRTSAVSVHLHPSPAGTGLETNGTLRHSFVHAARFQKGHLWQDPAFFRSEASPRLPDERTLSESPEP